MRWLSIGLLLGLVGCGETPPAPDAVARENAQSGDPGWPIDDYYLGDPTFELYARPLSVRAGERVDVPMSAAHPTMASWEIYRLGWYGGAGGRKLREGGPVPVSTQAAPTMDPGTGLVECHWTPTVSIQTNDDWLSGVYVLRATLPDGTARFAPFIIRDGRAADVVVVLPTSTDQAYNGWSGESLYVDTHLGFPIGHAYEVSFDRPFEMDEMGGIFLYSAMPAVRWLEANGYDVTYLADHDLERGREALGRARAVLTLAHDEYWSRAARDSYDAARDQGGTLGFLGANQAFWQVRYEPGDDGMPYRRMIGYKEAAALDPMADGPDVSDAFRGPRLQRPENGLLGVMSVTWYTVDFPWVVSDSSHWLYQGTGLADGDRLSALVGVESDALVANGAGPNGMVTVSRSPTIGSQQAAVIDQQAIVYETPAGGAVFSAASIRFAARLGGKRPLLAPQRMVRNLLAHAGAAPHGPEETMGASDSEPPADLSRAARSAVTLAGNGARGFADGPGAQARFDSPMGIALAPDGSLVVADSGNHLVRRVAADAEHTVSTLAGSGISGNDDGPALQARFQSPWAVAVAADGTVWVTDQLGRRVRTIAGGQTHTIAGAPDLAGPTGLAIASDGTVYVADIHTARILRIDPGGGVSELAITAAPDGPLHFPTGLAFDGPDLLIVDGGHHSVKRLDPAGRLTLVAGSNEGGFADGPARNARIAPVLGLAQLDQDTWLVGDAGNHRVRLLGGGTVRTFAGDLSVPTGLAIDPLTRAVYVSDSAGARILVLTP